MRQESTNSVVEAVRTREGMYLSGAEIAKILALLEEVRDTTQSRRMFKDATELTARLSGKTVDVSIANDDDEAL